MGWFGFGQKAKQDTAAQNVQSPVAGTSFFQNSFFTIPTSTLESNIRNGYEGNSLIAGAISFWQFTFPQALFSITEGTNDKALALLQKPNPEQSETDFKLSIITNILIGGETFILAGRNNKRYGAEVIQLWNYSPALMQPTYDQQGFLKGYLYYNPSQPDSHREYSPNDVIHLKWFARSAHNSNKGTSPVSQCFNEINTDNEIGRALYNYLKHDMLRGKIALVGDKNQLPNAEQRKEIKQNFIEGTSGSSQGMPVMMSGISSVIDIKGTFDELDTEGISSRAEAMVANVFGTSSILMEWRIGLNKATLNNVREADRRFNTRRFAPLLDMFAETITDGFKNKFGFDGDYKIGFDKSNMETFQELQREKEDRFIKLYKDGGISFPELREEIGREPIADGLVANQLRTTPEGARQFMELAKAYQAGLPIKTTIGIAVNTFGYTEAEAVAMFPVLADVSNTIVSPEGIITNPTAQ